MVNLWKSGKRLRQRMIRKIINQIKAAKNRNIPTCKSTGISKVMDLTMEYRIIAMRFSSEVEFHLEMTKKLHTIQLFENNPNITKIIERRYKKLNNVLRMIEKKENELLEWIKKEIVKEINDRKLTIGNFKGTLVYDDLKSILSNS